MYSKRNGLNDAWRVMLALVFALSIVGIPSGHVLAGSSFVVNSDDDASDSNIGDGICETLTGLCTLRAAVETANYNAGADTIAFLPTTLNFTLGSSLPIITDELTIDGSEASVTISGNNLYRVMRVSNSTVTLNHLSIVNGVSTDGGGIYAFNTTLTVMNSTFSGNRSTWGGAIDTYGGTLTVTDSIFSGNNGSYGGGIYTEAGATLTVTNSTFSSNDADGQGGGIYIQYSSLTVANSTFSDNSAVNAGGAIYNNVATLTVTDSTFSGNSGTSGGGFYSTWGTASITDSTFSGNSATTEGGGIYSVKSPLTVSNSTFSGNTSPIDGGAIYSFDESLTIANSTFSGNTAVRNGGAIYIFQFTAPSTLTLTNSTFSGNSALNGGALYNSAGTVTVTNSTFSGNIASTGHGGGIYDDFGTLNLSNTILANSTAPEDCYRVLPASNVNVNNLIESHVNCSAPSSTADPKLGPLTNNGGSTKTFALLAGSPAIDAGDDATCAASPVNGLDQRGMTRPTGTHCDIGALEARNTPATLTSRSVGTYDGWILESGENTNVGGTRDSTATTFSLGDGVADKQYRAFLSFDTAGLPDNAIISKVTLKIKRPGTGFFVGNNNPFSWGLGLKVDVCRNFFGTTIALQLGDFNFTNATNCKLLAGAFGGTPVASWYSANILSIAFTRISKTGTTQFRLRFAKDDNDDGAADYMKFYSGNFATATARPTLVIGYYVP